jgi:4-amino-4-deoxy-L-arabinose transferase-like glycosyltransferase
MNKKIINLENTKIQYLILALIMLLATGLRLYKMGTWSLWIEELHTLRHTNAINSLADILGNLRAIYFIMNKLAFLLLGESEWTARILPVFFGILAIPLIYWIAKRIFGLSIAILAIFLLAISPWHLYWSQNARFYTFFLLVFNISCIMYYLGIEKNRFVYIAISILTLILAVMTHLIGGLLVPVFILYYLLLKILPFEKPPGLKLSNLLPFIILPILGYVALESLRIFVLDAIPLYENFYTRFISTTRIFVGYQNPLIMLTSVVYYLGTPVTLSALFGSLFLLYQKDRAGLFLSVGAFLPLLIFMLVSPFVSVVNRYVFMTLPFWIILAAFGIQSVYRTRNPLLWILYLFGLFILLIRDPLSRDLVYYLRLEQYLPLYVILVAVILTIVILWLILRINSAAHNRWNTLLIVFILFILFIHPILLNTLYYEYQHGHRDNFKAATTLITANKYEGDRVVAAIPAMAAYYLEGETEGVRDFDANVEPQSEQRIWLIKDYGFDQQMGNNFADWLDQYCTMKGNWDNFTGGNNWKMRVYLCEA